MTEDALKILLTSYTLLGPIEGNSTAV